MRRIDALFTAWPFLGSRRMRAEDGRVFNREGGRRRLMRLIGISARPKAAHK